MKWPSGWDLLQIHKEMKGDWRELQLGDESTGLHSSPHLEALISLYDNQCMSSYAKVAADPHLSIPQVGPRTLGKGRPSLVRCPMPPLPLSL